ELFQLKLTEMRWPLARLGSTPWRSQLSHRSSIPGMGVMVMKARLAGFAFGVLSGAAISMASLGSSNRMAPACPAPSRNRCRSHCRHRLLSPAPPGPVFRRQSQARPFQHLVARAREFGLVEPRDEVCMELARLGHPAPKCVVICPIG